VKSEQEEEADTWSREFLIPAKYERELVGLKSESEIIAFADKIGIHPAIVLGRLQHDGLIQYQSYLNHLKESFQYD
jgi:HTH-type transcriptional regulator/antitoxin HigA